ATALLAQQPRAGRAVALEGRREHHLGRRLWREVVLRRHLRAVERHRREGGLPGHRHLAYEAFVLVAFERELEAAAGTAAAVPRAGPDADEPFAGARAALTLRVGGRHHREHHGEHPESVPAGHGDSFHSHEETGSLPQARTESACRNTLRGSQRALTRCRRG